MKAVASKSQGQAPAQAPAERAVIAKTEPGPGGKEAAIDKDQKLLEKAGRALMKVAIKAIEEAPKHKVNAHWVLQNREKLDHSYAQKGCIEGGFDQHGFGPDGRDQDSDATGRGKAVPSDCEVLGLSWMSGLPLFGSSCSFCGQLGAHREVCHCTLHQEAKAQPTSLKCGRQVGKRAERGLGSIRAIESNYKM